MITGRNDQMGCITNIVAGIVGAMVGGWIYRLITGIDYMAFDLVSLIIAVVGAVIVLAIVNLIFGRRQS
jgi:uncharacterized membrane protein YeaQ/YmgE (transglycosylase-associated protein family)